MAQTPADIQTIPAGNHNVEQEKRGRLPLGVGNKIGRSVKKPRLKTRRLKVMLHQSCDVGFIFQNKYGLAQAVRPRPAAG